VETLPGTKTALLVYPPPPLKGDRHCKISYSNANPHLYFFGNLSNGYIILNGFEGLEETVFYKKNVERTRGYFANNSRSDVEDLAKFRFANRVFGASNDLPEEIVFACGINPSNGRLDR